LSLKEEFNKDTWLYALIIVLLAPALFINIGLPVLIDDEALRAMVALEMKYSGNYIAPTLNGEFYYKKPPVYNWLLLAFFKLTGTINEWTIRIPTALFLLTYASVIYYYVRRHLSPRYAFLTAMMMVSCGRMLFYDSMLGLIDTSYSLITFLSFMVIFHYFEKQQWLRLFLLSYLLTAVGFLMKGLPSVVFQGATLLVYFTYRKQFLKLFSWQHIAGGLLFLSLIGSYYFAYHQYNSLEHVFATLFNESAKRTVANYSIWQTIAHVAQFPFEMAYHFLPWTLLAIYFFRKGIISTLRQNNFIVFCVLCFLSNILVYWTAPKVHPRYVFMLAPLAFAVFAYLHNIHQQERSLPYRLLYYLLGVCISLVALAAFAPLFLERTQAVAGLYYKVGFTTLLLLILSGAYWYRKEDSLLILVAVLLTVRIAFNWFVIPDRIANDYGTECRSTTVAAAQATASFPLAVYKERALNKQEEAPTEMQPTNNFYLTLTREAIVPVHFDNFAPDTLYIIDPLVYTRLNYKKVATFKVRHGKKIYHIGQPGPSSE
jgi:4-amino-4-deoxy-L-arabinose transferase-like glycosyltransferase